MHINFHGQWERHKAVTKRRKNLKVCIIVFNSWTQSKTCFWSRKVNGHCKKRNCLVSYSNIFVLLKKRQNIVTFQHNIGASFKSIILEHGQKVLLLQDVFFFITWETCLVFYIFKLFCSEYKNISVNDHLRQTSDMMRLL